MSDIPTPKTDAWVNEQTDKGCNVWSESVRFARTLERELAEVTAQRDAITLRLGQTQERMIDAERQRDRLAEALRDMVDIAIFEEWATATTGKQIVFKSAREALAAVEGGKES